MNTDPASPGASHASGAPGPSGPHERHGAGRVYGLLGGIASGKSTVARLIAGADGVVLDADAAVTELYDRAEFRARLAEAFGPGVLAPDGSIDRAKLAAAVFPDPAARKLLESWTHPAVRALLVDRYQAARRARVPRIVIDVPLLLEHDAQHGLAGLCDALIFVDTPDALREARAIATRGWKPGEVARREALQLPLAQKRARARRVIANDGDPARLEASVRAALRELESEHR